MEELKYQVHARDLGWLPAVHNGSIAGTTGESRPVEALRIVGMDIPGLGINGKACVQDLGWSTGNIQGEDIGSTGLGKHIECIVLDLFGEKADQYTLWYRVHVAEKGFLDWVRQGEKAGTEGGNLAIEAVQIMLVKNEENVWLASNTNLGYEDVTPNLTPAVETLEVRNFGPNEFKCPDCGGDVEYDLKVKVQKLRDLLSERAGHDVSLIITSGYRCPDENARCGGVANSKHMQGRACDLYAQGMMSYEMVEEIAYCALQVGLGVIRYHENLFCHVQLDYTDEVWN